MNGRDQEIYSKALFRSISYSELKSELESRKINFSPSDSYYILTLRLRRTILRESEGSNKVADRIDDEISAYEKSKHNVGSRFKCSLIGCPHIASNHRKYLSHLEFSHVNTSSRLTCQFRHNCSRDFPSFKLLKAHCLNVHMKRKSAVLLRQDQLVQQIVKLKCAMSSCGHQEVSTIKELKIHLNDHTDKREEVQCLFCAYSTNNPGSLRSHFSRSHKLQTVELLNCGIQQTQSSLIVEHDDSWMNAALEVSTESPYHSDPEEDNEDAEYDENESEDLFIRALAIMVIIRELTLFQVISCLLLVQHLDECFKHSLQYS